MPRETWVLPDVIDPDRVCITLRIPNEPHHIAAFWGNLLSLARWWNWDRDDDHTGAKVAAVWWEVFSEANSSFTGDCDVIQFRQPDDCDLEVSLDGVTWQPIFNALACATGAADNEIEKAINDGILGGPTQPGPATPPAPNECWTYHVTVQANAPWKIPISLNDGWTVSVSNVSGATFDGTFTPFWFCPDGGWFLLGQCGGSPHTESGDPLPTADHMALILQAGTVFTEILPGTYTVPSGTGAIDGVFQVNDSILGDNGGTVEFDLEVCSSNWEHIWDITGLADWTYSPLDHTGYDGTYVPGTGWVGANIGIIIEVPANCNISSWAITQSVPHEAEFVCQGTSPSYPNSAAWSATWLFGDDAPAATHIDRSLPSGPFMPAAGRYFAMSMPGGGGTTTLSQIIMRGNGDDPF